MGHLFTARSPASLPIWFLLLSIGAAFQITGISAGVDPNTGSLPLRLPISQFASSGAAFDLFILSLRQLQSTNQSALLSYFQIAGIHGYPHIPWDDVVGTGGYPGYCTHVAVPFPTWHRPYMVLYEQAIWTNAQIIARTYPLSQRQEYISAAITMRIPYWDWAAYPSLPDVVAEPTISVNTANGYTTIDNPLYNYTFQGSPEVNGFPSGDPMAPFPWTVRQWNAGLQTSNQSASNATLWAQAPTLLAMTYQLFTTVTDYTSFSCTNPGGGSNTANNIENLHNSIHNSIGGWGHMTFPEVSAFDPVFYLHHANVDRMFAMWQALNPHSYIVPTVNTYGTYYELQGFVDSGNTSLAPFHLDNGTTMYTSDDVRGTRRFGYTYPELVDWNISAADLASKVRYEINLMYNPSVFSATPNTSKISNINKFGARAVDIGQAFSNIGFEEARSLGVNNMDMQWFISLRVQRYASSSAFTIDFFIGDPLPNPMSWSTAPNLIGSHAQFISGNVSMMHPYGTPRGLVHGEVSLTHSLAGGVARGIILDLSAGSVVPLLTEHLNWRARSADGREIDVGSLSGLSISIGSKSVRPATSGTEFPIYGQVKWHPTVTRGKTGGA